MAFETVGVTFDKIIFFGLFFIGRPCMRWFIIIKLSGFDKKVSTNCALDKKMVTLLLLILEAAMMCFGSPTWLVIPIK